MNQEMMKRLMMWLFCSRWLCRRRLRLTGAQAQEAPDALIKRVASDVLATLKSDKDICRPATRRSCMT